MNPFSPYSKLEHNIPFMDKTLKKKIRTNLMVLIVDMEMVLVLHSKNVDDKLH
jgi:hypothetical protein